ncbi:MAG: hypothetical protein HY717_09235 [Planctomycetes bacterium]|nr:hypothetical protein [Planctomycetota bacterium]
MQKACQLRIGIQGTGKHPSKSGWGPSAGSFLKARESITKKTGQEGLEPPTDGFGIPAWVVFLTTVNNLFNINLGKFNEMFTGFFSNFITRCRSFPDKTRTKGGQGGADMDAGATL